MTEHDYGIAPVIYLLGGVAVGIGVGMMLAPGEETRRDIREWLGRERNSLRHKRERLAAAYKAGRRAYSDGERETAPA